MIARLQLLLLAAMTLGACRTPAPPADGARVRLVATFSILGDLVAHVGGEEVNVHAMVGPEGDAHTFEPSPADGATLAEAAVVFEIGLGFEPWLDDLYSASGSTAIRAPVTMGIEPQAESALAGEDPGSALLDPHVWHDVGLTMRMVEAIRDALVLADLSQAAAYRANAQAYLDELQSLDAWVVDQVSRLPPQRRKLVTSHDTFGYFASRYGFEILGTALGAASTEAADPSAGEIAALVEDIRASGVPAIFVEDAGNPQLMARIAEEAGVRLAPPLYTDSLGPPGSPADTYLKLVRHNVQVMVAALSQ